MFGNLGFTEIAIILLILVLFFGAKRIPEIGASIGKGIKEFKRGLSKDEAIEPPSPAPPAVESNQGTSTGSPKRLSQ
jgi:sec-independent protein translocase protein TatA